MNMCIYHAIAKSNTLPLDNKDTPSVVLLSRNVALEGGKFRNSAFFSPKHPPP